MDENIFLVVKCKDIMVELDEFGNVIIVLVDVDDGFYYICDGIMNMILS